MTLNQVISLFFFLIFTGTFVIKLCKREEIAPAHTLFATGALTYFVASLIGVVL